MKKSKRNIVRKFMLHANNCWHICYIIIDV